MIVLIANLGSTSFKYKLFDLSEGEAVLAEGAADRIGQMNCSWSLTPFVEGAEKRTGREAFPHHGAAIELHLAELVHAGVVESIEAVNAIGFKAVHGGPISEPVRVDDEVLRVMGEFADAAPQHNPPYIDAIHAFRDRLPNVPQVAAFETGFHQTIPASRTTYAIPHEWTEELGVRRYGFHGASHRYIATRMAEVQPGAGKIISCHLGGSSSICAIESGRSVATSMGLTPQAGLPQSARVGDIDIFALRRLRAHGIDAEEALERLGKDAGLLGMSGVSSDLRDIEGAADEGDERAKLAVEVFVESIRHYLGAYLAVLGGADAVCFTGGIGQHAGRIRSAALAGFGYAGIELDEAKNDAADPNAETRIESGASRAAVWVLPTNEELVVARQTAEVLGDF